MTAPDQPTGDHDIIALMRAGQSLGLEALLRVYGGRVKGLLGATFHRPDGDHALEDAVCDASRELFRHARKLDPDRNLAGCLYVSARRQLLRWLQRERKWHKPIWDGAEEEIAAATNSLPTDRFALSERVRAAIDRLPVAEREILGLDMAHDFKIEAREVARLLGTTRKTVYSLRNRTKGKLQRLLQPEFRKPGEP